MHTFARIILAALLLAGTASAQAAPSPQQDTACDGSDGVYLYEETQYRGRCLRLTEDVDDLSLYGFNNAAASLRFEGEWTATLYVDQNYAGPASTFTDDDSDLNNNTIRANSASSVRVQSGIVPQENRCDGAAGVYLYEHTFYEGRCIRFTEDVPDLSDYGFNNIVSSVAFVGEWTATLYPGQDYGGTGAVFSAADPDLSDTAVGNDDASSLRVAAGGSPAPAPGSSCDGTPGVYLYEHPTFEGRCLRLTASVTDLRTLGFNDTVSSVRVVGSWIATLYADLNFTGAATPYTGDSGYVGYDVIGDNQATSVDVRPNATVPGTNACDGGPGVYVYEHPNYEGRCARFTDNVPDLRPYGFDDTISSIRVVGSWLATLYADLNYSGAAATYAQGSGYVGNEPIGDNQATSIQVAAR